MHGGCRGGGERHGLLPRRVGDVDGARRVCELRVVQRRGRVVHLGGDRRRLVLGVGVRRQRVRGLFELGECDGDCRQRAHRGVGWRRQPVRRQRADLDGVGSGELPLVNGGRNAEH